MQGSPFFFADSKIAFFIFVIRLVIDQFQQLVTTHRGLETLNDVPVSPTILLFNIMQNPQIISLN